MTPPNRDPHAFLPLRPVEFEILITLAHGERHGYAILQETEARSEGALQLETGTMYRALRRLVDDGLARPSARRPVESDDERRRYYAVTPLGLRVAAAETARMARLVDIARSAPLLASASGSLHALPHATSGTTPRGNK